MGVNEEIKNFVHSFFYHHKKSRWKEINGTQKHFFLQIHGEEGCDITLLYLSRDLNLLLIPSNKKGYYHKY